MHGDADFIDLRGSEKRIAYWRCTPELRNNSNSSASMWLPGHPAIMVIASDMSCPSCTGGPGSQRFEDIRNRQYPRGETQLLAGKPLGVASPVQFLVMPAGNLRHLLQVLRKGQLRSILIVWTTCSLIT